MNSLQPFHVAAPSIAANSIPAFDFRTGALQLPANLSLQVASKDEPTRTRRPPQGALDMWRDTASQRAKALAERRALWTKVYSNPQLADHVFFLLGNSRPTGPQVDHLIVPSGAISKTAEDPRGFASKKEIRREIKGNMQPFLDQMDLISPHEKDSVAIHTGYKGYIPLGTEEDRDLALLKVAISTAELMVKVNAKHPGKMPLDENHNYLLLVHEFQKGSPLLSAEGRAVRGGHIGFAPLDDFDVVHHELGHLKGGTHEAAGTGPFKLRPTIMSGGSLLNIFRVPRFSDENVRNIRTHKGLDPETGLRRRQGSTPSS